MATLLIIDDEKAIRKTLTEILSLKAIKSKKQPTAKKA
jgi:YesN/AraC family two-component response regulator